MNSICPLGTRRKPFCIFNTINYRIFHMFLFVGTLAGILIPIAQAIRGGTNSTKDFTVWTVTIGASVTSDSPQVLNSFATRSKTLLCTGTLLSNEWVLTTTSCLSSLTSQDGGIHVNNLRVYAGCADGPTKACSQVLSGSKIYKHPCYEGVNSTEPAMQKNDIQRRRTIRTVAFRTKRSRS